MRGGSKEGRAPAPTGALLPPRLLGVGVTGHRLERLGADCVGPLTAAAAQVLERIEAAADSVRTGLRVVSSLADGADCIVAEAGLARGWRLDAVLPFAGDGNQPDFTAAGSWPTHEGLVARAGAVFELPGDRAASGGAGIAYERAGRIVLAQSDMLVAIWDGSEAGKRGGAVQMVSEAVLAGIPVIHIDSAGRQPPAILWDGLEEHDLGQHSVDTVPRLSLDMLPRVVAPMIDPPVDPIEAAMLRRFESGRMARASVALAYPLLLAVAGVRRVRRTDLFPDHAADAAAADLMSARAGDASAFDRHRRASLGPRFARANAIATQVAQLFRSSYVINFSFAALAVVLSLSGIALPSSLKPVLIATEFGLIAGILLLTRAGNRAAWHRRWLDNRLLAERLRCLALSTQLGDLDLRARAGETGSWVNWYARATAREIGLPPQRVDDRYLVQVRAGLVALIDDQIAYLSADARRMHRLEHRLHGLGTLLFALTALVCVGFLALEGMHRMLHLLDGELPHGLLIAITITGAALPAIGAAIYGIRMQGDFAGNAERSHLLCERLHGLRKTIDDDAIGFDTLYRRVRHTADLLIEDTGIWLRTYRARPLALPG